MQKLLLTALILSVFCSVEVTTANNPSIQCPANLTVTVADINCRASVALPSVYVQSNCGPISTVKAFWADGGTAMSLTAALEFETDSTGTDTLGFFGMVADFPIGKTTIQYVVTDSCGNSSACSFELTVLGSTPPSCTAPADISVSCAAFDPTLALYGGLADQSCSVDLVQVLVDWSGFDSLCARGTLLRHFTVFDAGGQTGACSQKIVADYVQEYYIRFPHDVIATVCNSTGIYGEPTILGNGCELLGISYQDQMITWVPDACFKVQRDWAIINWCTYNPAIGLVNVPNPNPNAIANHPTNLPGPVVSPIQTVGDPWRSTIVKINPTDPSPTNFSIYYNANANGYRYTQSIKIIDNQGPVLQNCPNQLLTVLDTTHNNPELWNEPYWWHNLSQSHDLSEAPTELSITATDACYGSNINFAFELFLDLNDDGNMETVVKSSQLGANGLGWNNVLFDNVWNPGVSRQFDERNVPPGQKWGFALQHTLSGNNVTASVKFNTYDAPNTYLPLQLPHGRHQIKWKVTDGCGSERICEYEIKVRDGQAPVVTCKTISTVSLLINCVVQVWATDFVSTAQDNATPSPFLKFGIRKAGTDIGFPLNSQGEPNASIVYTGADLGSQSIEIWCIDQAGNAAFCQTTFLLTDNSGGCDPSLGTVTVSGYVKNEHEQGIKDVGVDFTGIVNFAPPFNFFLGGSNGTDSTGHYSIQNSIPIAAILAITPVKDDQPLNGVNSFDLTLISRHILDTEPITSPYKLIAADANRNGSITSFDIIELRKLILGIYQELPNNTSWRFVPKNYVFPNPLNPFMPPYPQNISIAQVLEDITNGNFIGMKIGDVNNSAVLHATEAPDERSASHFYFQVDAKGHESVQAGELLELQFNAEAPLAACQFTLHTYGLELLDILPGENMAREHFALFPDKNALTMAWEKGGMASFALKCRATEPGNIRDMLRISSQITKAEAYRENNSGQAARFQPALRFPEQGGFELFQNRPNPFNEATEIGFNLPDAAVAILKIYDMNGRLLHSQTGEYPKGINTIRLAKSGLQTSGVYYYQLETTQHNAIRKMTIH